MGSQSSPIQASIPSEESRVNEQELTRIVGEVEHWQVSPSSLSNERAGLSQSQCVLTVMTFSCFELTTFKSSHWFSQCIRTHQWRSIQSYSRTPYQLCYKYPRWALFYFPALLILSKTQLEQQKEVQQSVFLFYIYATQNDLYLLLRNLHRTLHLWKRFIQFLAKVADPCFNIRTLLSPQILKTELKFLHSKK